MPQRNKTIEFDNEGHILICPSLHQTTEESKMKQLLRLLKRLKKDTNFPMPLLDHLRLILENSHNTNTFRYRCEGFMIITETMLDSRIVASYSDAHDADITICSHFQF